MNIGEARAVDVLLHYLLPAADVTRHRPTEADAKAAAVKLAKRSADVLCDVIDAEEVEEHWPVGPAEATCTGCGCTDSRACRGGCYWVSVDRVARTGICSSCDSEEG